MLILQFCLYCALFTAMVALLSGAVNGLYFYPKPVQERAYVIGLADRTVIVKKNMMGMELVRTTTIAEGGERCDFRYHRKKHSV